MRSTRDDILPSQIVSDFSKESDGYLKYRVQFKQPYKHFLSCIGLDQRDWNLSRPRSDLRCNALFQQLVPLYTMTDRTQFLSEIRPAFQAAIAAEDEHYGQMKRAMQEIYDFFANDFEEKKAEFAALGPELETLQKNRSTEPEDIQQLDKVMSRFTELQRMLKAMIQPGVSTIQAQHLKAIRETTEIYQKLNDQWSRCFFPFTKFKPRVTVKSRNNEEKGKDKADKLAEDDRDM